MNNYARYFLILAVLTVSSLIAGTALALSPETEVLLELLQSKGIINQDEADSFKKTIEERMNTVEVPEHRHSVQGLAQRVQKLEDAKEGMGAISDKISLTGFVEVEGNYTSTDTAAPGTTDSNESDITLAKAEVDVDADINKYVLGHIAFLYEDDSNVTVDEGLIVIDGKEKCPLYLRAGKFVVPFGRYESHFIADPLTKVLGETNDGAVVAGYANEIFDVSVGTYRGVVKQSGNNNHINSIVASGVYTMPSSTLLPDLGLTMGISYTNNIAASNSLQDTGGSGVNAEEISDLIGGFGAFLMTSYKEKLYFDAEYVGATDEFGLNDLGADFINTASVRYQPRTWNIELAYALTPRLEIAAKYEGSDDYESIVPEEQYGTALLYSLFGETSLVFEYLYGEFKNKDERNSFTTQLAVEF